MKNLPHEIINHLFEHYADIEQPILLNDLANKLIVGKTDLQIAKTLKLILDTFETKGYISWSTSTYAEGVKAFLLDDSYKNELGVIDRHGKQITLKYVNARALLTPTGLDYAIDKDRQRVQHRNNNLAVLFVGATVIITGFTLFMELRSHKRIEKEQQQLRDTLRSRDNSMQNVQNAVNYLIQERRSDSIKNVSVNAKAKAD